MAVQVFGAGAVQSAYVSYLALDITPASLTLVWSDAYVDVPYIDPVTGIHYQSLAAYMDVMTGNPNDNTITLPNATQTSVGQNFIITNKGAADFLLNTSDGALLQNVTVGLSYYVILTDNSTAPGVWSVATLAAGTSQASAVLLAGNGLVAIIDKLNTNIPVVSVNAPVVIDTTYRAQLLVWTGGAATQPLPPIASVPPGFYLSFSNLGTGTVILQPAPHVPLTTIQSLPNLEVALQQSLTIISDGTNWQTLGFGQNQFAVDTVLRLDVSASVNVTLTPIQASSIVQEYSGALTGNITVFFPIATNNWFIKNNTTGPHTLSVQLAGLAGPVGATYVVPQGSVGTFFSDVGSLFPSPTALSLINGSVTAPALSFLANPGSGIFNDPGNGIKVSIDGTEVCNIDTGGTEGLLVVFADDGTPFTFVSAPATASILYNEIEAISIDTLGAVTLPAAPLDIGSGGTNADNKPDAINNLMPDAVAGGLAYFDGTNWVILPIGTAGQTLTVSVGGLPVWA